MKKYIGFLLLFVSQFVWASSIDRVVAVVNEGVITQSELSKQIIHVKDQLQKNEIKSPDKKAFEKQVLDHMIIRSIQLQMANRFNIEIDQSVLNHTISQLATENKISLEQFKKEVQSKGMTFTKFKQELKNDLTINQLQREMVARNVSVSDDEIEDFLRSHPESKNKMTEYYVQNILIPLPESPSPEVLKQAQYNANKIMASLEQGADFSMAAASSSAGQKAFEGGDLGWRKEIELPSVFVDPVKVMKKGQIKGPIRAGNGFHILKLVDKRDQTVAHYVTQTKARHILVNTDVIVDDNEAKAKLELLRDRALNGEKFEVLAENYSQDTASAAQGGSLGWMSPGMLVPEFEKAMNQLSKNQISQPFQTQFGWHIVQVIDRKNVDDSKNMRKNQIKEFIHARKYEEEVENWLQQIKSEAYVKVMG